MKSFVKKWKNLLMISFLCAAVALSTGCGGKSSGSVEQTELPVVEESVEEQETQENQSADNTEYESGGEETNNSSGDESGWGEDGYTTDGETYGDDTYSDENEGEEEQDWNASDDGEDYSGDDSYSVANDDEGGDTDPEDSGYNEQEDGSGSGNKDRDYGDEYEGSGGEISENGVYTTKEDVSLYLHTYGRLPNNFMTKKEAKKLGWSGVLSRNMLRECALEETRSAIMRKSSLKAITTSAISIPWGRIAEERKDWSFRMTAGYTIQMTTTGLSPLLYEK